MSSPTLVATYESIVVQTLIRLREQQGLKQAGLADAVGVTPSTWSRIEAGLTSLSLEQLKQAADALGVRPSQVLSIADDFASQSEAIKVTSKREIDSINKAVAVGVGAAGLSAAIPLSGVVLGTAVGGVMGGLIAKYFSSEKKKESDG